MRVTFDKYDKLASLKELKPSKHQRNKHPKEQIERLDLFGGSGSTLIACEKTNRKCFMMEIDPHYVDVIIARWEKYTGKKAELLNGQTKEADKRRTSKKPGGDKLLIRRNGSGAAMR